MAFEQALRAYLEGLEREPRLEIGRPVREIDAHELYRHLVEQMRSIEAEGLPGSVAYLLPRWPRARIVELARFLEMQPRQLVPVEPASALAYACRVVNEAIGWPGSTRTLSERLEAEHMLAEFEHGGTSVERYAIENRLVSRDGRSRTVLSEVGRILLRLRGREAIRWLITLETLQSTGALDAWRISPELLERVLRSGGFIIYFDEVHPPVYSRSALERAVDLGVLEDLAEDVGTLRHYRVTSALRDAVQAVLEPGPWHTAIRALLDDELAAIVPGSSSISETTVEQTKLIAHEVRNALIPVRHDLLALRSLVQVPSHQERVDNARDGVQRVLTFIEQMVEVSELITEPLSRCEIGTVVNEALGWIDVTRRVRRPADHFGALSLMAPRNRLARAISNVVGNALQATTADQPVRVAIAPGAASVRIIVDDGGPGVAPEHRRSVFLDGVTMRKDGGGSGFGLAFARRVVEDTLHGRIWCEDSDLGGARFVIELPEPSPE